MREESPELRTRGRHAGPEPRHFRLTRRYLDGIEGAGGAVPTSFMVFFLGVAAVFGAFGWLAGWLADADSGYTCVVGACIGMLGVTAWTIWGLAYAIAAAIARWVRSYLRR
ncbi:hypothetical protein WDY66_06695 [Dermacoccus nishinomiyaensis]|uniref:hypothetical protein n=1 Tax=Dermacoccus nishinomiyaensis TaxID=1274 RepID=UPI0011A27520|nr:hypothetical protein [Dermacoccus nishinomiyaensis]